jgi:signal transduction histidine kinase
MVQEALNNAIRHARASEVRIRFDVDGCRWTAEIRDDGCGYDTTVTYTGRGIHNLRQRAKLLSAKLNIVSIQGTGTVVYLSLPIKLVT